MADLIALYGTLMSGLAARPGVPRLATHIELLGGCLLDGRLYDFGPYPCLVPGDEAVHGELWRAISGDALAILDEWEEYDPSSPGRSVYVRRRVRLRQPNVLAWAYYWNRPTDGLGLIVGGDWRTHVLHHRGGDGTKGRAQ